LSERTFKSSSSWQLYFFNFRLPILKFSGLSLI